MKIAFLVKGYGMHVSLDGKLFARYMLEGLLKSGTSQLRWLFFETAAFCPTRVKVAFLKVAFCTAACRGSYDGKRLAKKIKQMI